VARVPAQAFVGAAALLATLAAQSVKDHLAQCHEGLHFAISLALASGVPDYAPSIVWRIFAINIAAQAALFLVHRLGVRAGLAKKRPVSPARQRSTLRASGSRFRRSFRAVFPRVRRLGVAFLWLLRARAARLPHGRSSKLEYSIK
jgi:hypothetical protein